MSAPGKGSNVATWFVLWLALAVLIRLGAALTMSEFLGKAKEGGIAADGWTYYAPMAENLAAGRGFLHADGELVLTHVPGYPLLLAGFKLALGSMNRAVLSLQILTGSLCVAMVFLLGNRVFPPAVAHIAAGVSALFPDLVVYSLLNLSESPFLFLFLLGVYFLVRALSTDRLSTGAVLGLVVGLGILVREGAVILAALWALVLLSCPPRRAWRRRMLATGAFAGVVVLTLCPWWARNWRVTHEFVPLTSKGAWNIWCGTMVRPYYLTDHRNKSVKPDATTLAVEESVRRQVAGARTLREKDKILLTATWERVTADPSGQLVHLMRKFLFLWQPNIAPRHAGRTGLGPILWGVAAAHYVLLGIGVVGLWHVWRSYEGGVILVLTFVVWVVFHAMVGIGEPRYHLPMLPLLILAGTAWGYHVWHVGLHLNLFARRKGS